MAEYNRMETKSEGEAGEGAVARTKGSERKREGRTKNVGEGGLAKNHHRSLVLLILGPMCLPATYVWGAFRWGNMPA